MELPMKKKEGSIEGCTFRPGAIVKFIVSYVTSLQLGSIDFN